MGRIHLLDETQENAFCGYIRTGDNEDRFTKILPRTTCISCKNFKSGKWNRYPGIPYRKELQMLDLITNTVLANLDWLMLHKDCKLDFAAGVILGADGEPEYLVGDLATPGLTPATEPACYRSPIGAMVHGPGCPHTP